MSIYSPYAYLIGWSKYNKWYYGIQYGKSANPKNLWKTYFTSSEFVKEFREKYGEPDVIEIRKTFFLAEESLVWEEKVLRRIDAVNSDKWLNKGNSGKDFNTAGMPAHNRGIPHSDLTKQKISKANKGKTHTQEAKEKISKFGKGRPKSSIHKEKISLANKGKKRKDPNKCATYGFLGKKLSPEAIQKRTESRRRNRLLRQHMLSINPGANI